MDENECGGVPTRDDTARRLDFVLRVESPYHKSHMRFGEHRGKRAENSE